MKIISQLTEGGIKSQAVGSNKPLIIGAMIIAVAGFAGGIIYKSSDNSTVSTKDQTVSSTIEKKIEAAQEVYTQNKTDAPKIERKNTETPALKEVTFPIYGNHFNNEQKKELEQLGSFEIPKDLKTNQISRHVSKEQFKQGKYLTSLISFTEGYRSRWYNDVGYAAIGNGTNIGKQSVSYTKKLIGSISTDSNYISEFTKWANRPLDNTIADSFNKVQLSPQRAIQLARIMSFGFEAGVIKTFQEQAKRNPMVLAEHQKTGKSISEIGAQRFKALSINEQAALIAIAYQTGSLNRYGNSIQKIINYTYGEKNKDNAMNAIRDIEIKYTYQGVTKNDTNSETLKKMLFVDPDKFYKIIDGKITPKDMVELAPIVSNSNGQSNYTVKKSMIGSDTVELNDPIGELIARLEELREKDPQAYFEQIEKYKITYEVDDNGFKQLQMPDQILLDISKVSANISKLRENKRKNKTNGFLGRMF